MNNQEKCVLWLQNRDKHIVQTLNAKLEQAYNEYKKYKHLKEFGSAFEVLGQIQNVANNYYLDNRDKYYWTNIVDAEYKAFANLTPVYGYLSDRVDLIKQVVSVGTVFNGDEIILLLTASIEIEMISSLLANFNHECVDVKIVNELIEEIIEVNEKDFRNSVIAIRKNSVLPVINYWISDYA